MLLVISSSEFCDNPAQFTWSYGTKLFGNCCFYSNLHRSSCALQGLCSVLIDPMATTGHPGKEKKLCVGRRVAGLGRRDRKLENQDRTTLETSRSDYGHSHRLASFPSEETEVILSRNYLVTCRNSHPSFPVPCSRRNPLLPIP